jgi:hypothetical protein
MRCCNTHVTSDFFVKQQSRHYRKVNTRLHGSQRSCNVHSEIVGRLWFEWPPVASYYAFQDVRVLREQTSLSQTLWECNKEKALVLVVLYFAVAKLFQQRQHVGKTMITRNLQIPRNSQILRLFQSRLQEGF